MVMPRGWARRFELVAENLLNRGLPLGGTSGRAIHDRFQSWKKLVPVGVDCGVKPSLDGVVEPGSWLGWDYLEGHPGLVDMLAAFAVIASLAC